MIFLQLVETHAAGLRIEVTGVGDDDPVGVDVHDLTIAFGHETAAGILGHLALDAGADQRLLGHEQRHGLALHVRAHEGAVGVVVLQERDERRGDGHDLSRGDVHEGHFLAGHDGELTFHTCLDEGVLEPPVVAEDGVGLGDDVTGLRGRLHVLDVVGDVSILDHAVRGLDETVVVHQTMGGQGHDEADVRTFGGFDGTDAAVMAQMDVANLEPGAFTRQTAGPEGGQAALVRDLGQGVGLIHELGQLRCAEELLEHGRDRLGVDQVMGHERSDFLKAHALLDGALHANEADAVLVLDQFANRADAAVPEVIDVVGRTVGILQLDELLDRAEDVLVGQGAVVDGQAQAETGIELIPPHRRQVVVVGVAEQVVEKAGRNLGGRRGTGAQALVNVDLSAFQVLALVHGQGVAHTRGHLGAGGEYGAQLGNSAGLALLDGGRGQGISGTQDDLAGLRVHDVHGGEFRFQGFRTDLVELDPCFDNAPPHGLGHGLAGSHDNRAVRGDDIGVGHFLAKIVFLDLAQNLSPVQAEGFLLVVVGQDVLTGHAHGLEQDRGGHLPTTVDADVEDVLVVEVEIKPGAAHGDDAAAVEDLAAGVGLARVVFENDAGRALELVDDDPFRAVDQERPLLGDEGNGSEIYVLFLDVMDGAAAGRFVHIVDSEADLDAQGGFEGQALGDALIDIILGLADLVADIFQGGSLVEVMNGKDRTKHAFKPDVRAHAGGDVGLEKFVVGIKLKA
ncbi:hypothetical protein DSECCO2_425020 [anaerobic digester metagenome]